MEEFEFLQKLELKEQRKLNSLIETKIEQELLWNYLLQNPLPFCIKRTEHHPFEVKSASVNQHILLIEMIKKGELVLKENAKIQLNRKYTR